MKKLIMCSLLLCCIMFFVAGSAFAKKPTDDNGDYLGNNFPSGFHFNLNIHGKKNSNCPDSFNGDCGDADDDGEIDDHTGDFGTCEDTDLNNVPSIGDTWKYSNSLFIPELSPDDPALDCITIKMQSGNRKSDISDLIIKDPCSGFDCPNDDALFELPHCQAGYGVYLRVLGKYTDNPENSITLTPGLSFVEDANFQDLLYLGLITKDGWYTGSGETYERKKGKANKAIDISNLFQYTGDVCYFNTNDCPDPTECTANEQYFCCSDTDILTPDGIYDVCIERADLLDPCPDWIYNAGDQKCYLDENFNGQFDDPISVPSPDGGTCPITVQETVYCQYYEGWIFNIGDLVEYLWDVNNQGVKLLQIRFYPIDPSCIPSS